MIDPTEALRLARATVRDVPTNLREDAFDHALDSILRARPRADRPEHERRAYYRLAARSGKLNFFQSRRSIKARAQARSSKLYFEVDGDHLERSDPALSRDLGARSDGADQAAELLAVVYAAANAGQRAILEGIRAGLTHAEIAERLGVSTAAIGARLDVLRERVRDFVMAERRRRHEPGYLAELVEALDAEGHRLSAT